MSTWWERRVIMKECKDWEMHGHKRVGGCEKETKRIIEKWVGGFERLKESKTMRNERENDPKRGWKDWKERGDEVWITVGRSTGEHSSHSINLSSDKKLAVGGNRYVAICLLIVMPALSSPAPASNDWFKNSSTHLFPYLIWSDCIIMFPEQTS